MPEPPSSPADALESQLATDRARGIAPDATLVGFEAVTAGVGTTAKKRLGFGAWLAIVWLVLIVGAAVFAPYLGLADPINDVFHGLNLQGPSTSHYFGVDGNGRDVFSRVIWGARNSLFIGVVSVVAGFLAGGTLGIIAGYFKGRIGGFLGAVTDLLLAFPQLILALAIVTFLGRTIGNVTLALAIVATPVLARIARASALSWSEREFVLAARAQGARHRRIMLREILPNVLPAMFSIALLGIAVVIVAEAGLAIIGAGVKPEVVTWGNVIVSGQGDLRDAPHVVLAPSLAIFFTVLALNYLGDVVRARSDVRESAL